MSNGRDPVGTDRDEMRAYLLGSLSADRQASLEEAIFDDDEAYDAVLDEWYDLLDDYARGTLPASERELVERRLLGDRVQNALRVADLLARRRSPALAGEVAAPLPPRKRDWRLLATAAVAVLAIGTAVRVALDNDRLRNELSRAAAPVVPAADAGDRVARIELTPRTTRSDAPQEVSIPPSATVIEMVVPVDETAAEYRATLEGRDGVLWTERRLSRAPDGALHVWLRAAQLTDGAYELLVYGGPLPDAPLVAAVPFLVAP
jgi:hypothetical protein